MTQAGIERLNTLLGAAARVSRSIASILDLPLLLHRTVDVTCDEFGFYYAGIFLLDESGEYAVLAAGRGDAGQAMLAEGHKLQVGGNSMIGDAILKRSGRIALDVGEEAIFFKNPHLPKTRSEMALPLIAGEQVIGALTVQSEQGAAFTDGDIAALQTMADQLAVAIQNARLNQQNSVLLQQTERRARLFKAANIVGREVTLILSLDELLPKMVDTIVETYGFYYAGIFLLEKNGQWAALRAGYGQAGQAMLAEGHRLKVGGNSMIGDCISKSKARIAPDVGQEEIFFKNPYLRNTRSEMALPLIFGGKALGAVTVQSVDEHAFSQDDITTLQTMADHLAVAIENAYSLEALKAAHIELLRTKVYEALTVATTEAIHWIGNKALPISVTVTRLKDELGDVEPNMDSVREDLDLITESARLIIAVKEQLIGQAREQRPHPVLVSDVLRAAALDRGIPRSHFTFDLDPQAAYVIADSTQLTRAVGNILSNAAEAGANHIIVSAAPDVSKNEVVIQIVDNGAGISPAALEKIWSPFYTTKDGDHTGLGLPAALHVISQLQGNITIESQEGKSTTVRISLPAANPGPWVVKAGPRKIQLIDDNDEWAFSLAEVLGSRLVRATEPDPSADLILIDEHLESLELDVILARIAKAGLGKKTIIITTALNVDRMIRHLKIVRDVLMKPYTSEEVAKLLA